MEKWFKDAVLQGNGGWGVQSLKKILTGWVISLPRGFEICPCDSGNPMTTGLPAFRVYFLRLHPGPGHLTELRSRTGAAAGRAGRDWHLPHPRCGAPRADGWFPPLASCPSPRSGREAARRRVREGGSPKADRLRRRSEGATGRRPRVPQVRRAVLAAPGLGTFPCPRRGGGRGAHVAREDLEVLRPGLRGPTRGSGRAKRAEVGPRRSRGTGGGPGAGEKRAESPCTLGGPGGGLRWAPFVWGPRWAVTRVRAGASTLPKGRPPTAGAPFPPSGRDPR